MRFAKACFAFLLAAMPLPAMAQAPDAGTSQSVNSDVFDAQSAWDEFEATFRGIYAYIDRDDIDVDAQLARSKALALQAIDKNELRKVLHQTALTFADPHLIVGPFTDDDYSIVMSAADLDVAFEGDVALVRDVRRGSPAYAADIRPGDSLVSIQALSPREAARLPFGAVLPNPSPGQLDYGLLLAANGKRGSDRVLELRRGDGPVRTVELVSATAFARSLGERDLVTQEFIGAQSDIAVISVLNSLGENETIGAFDQAMVEAAGARAIILDMRDTPSGGNTEVARSIIGHFITEVRPYQMHVIPVFEREFSVPRQFVEYVHPREPYFDGPVFVLHGRWTGSMGEGIVIGLDAASDAITVGSDMGDLLGALWNRDLRQIGARLDLAGEALFHVDGTPREDYVAQVPLTPVDTGQDGSDPGIAAVLRILAGD
ncbi:MAG: hypothetical protein AAGK02_03320 [Pseudomonadota bacterium]